MAQDGGSGGMPTTGLLRLPVELRECVYEHYLALLKPTTFALVKYPKREHWTFTADTRRIAPSLLLVCRAISDEFQKVMFTKLSSGPIDSIPLSRGPTIRIGGPRLPSYISKDDIWERTFEQHKIPQILRPILSKGAPAISLRLAMPQSQEDETLFMCMLRFVVALCNDRTTPLKLVHAVRGPMTSPVWQADDNAVYREVNHIRCESKELENWYTSWFQPHSAAHRRSVENWAANISRELGVEEAWIEVLKSCRKTTKYSGGWPFESDID